MKSWAPFFIFSLAISWGAVHSRWEASTEAARVWTEVDGRDPASVPEVYNFSGKNTGDLIAASSKRVLEGLSLQDTAKKFGLSVGLFGFANRSGETINACAEFKYIHYILESEGFSEGGRVPTLEIEAPCVADSADSSRSKMVWVPKDEIAKSSGDFDISRDGGVRISLMHRPPEGWSAPVNWRLKQIQLLGARAGKDQRESSEIGRSRDSKKDSDAFTGVPPQIIIGVAEISEKIPAVPRIEIK